MTMDDIFKNLGTSPASKPPATEYEAGYRAFSEDPDGSIAKAVFDHFSGKMRLDSTRYTDDWFFGYQDATDDFNNAQAGGE